jgi:hypothetical protein
MVDGVVRNGLEVGGSGTLSGQLKRRVAMMLRKGREGGAVAASK